MIKLLLILPVAFSYEILTMNNQEVVIPGGFYTKDILLETLKHQDIANVFVSDDIYPLYWMRIQGLGLDLTSTNNNGYKITIPETFEYTVQYSDSELKFDVAAYNGRCYDYEMGMSEYQGVTIRCGSHELYIGDNSVPITYEHVFCSGNVTIDGSTSTYDFHGNWPGFKEYMNGHFPQITTNYSGRTYLLDGPNLAFTGCVKTNNGRHMAQRSAIINVPELTVDSQIVLS